VADALAGAGLAVSAPLLPGHGTAMDDMLTTVWDDWYGAAEAAYVDLAGRVDKVVVVGLSMGGTLAVALAADHPEAPGVAVINPYVDPPAESFRDLLHGLLDQGITVAPGAGSDIAEPTEEHLSYDGTPLRPLLSLCEALDRLGPRLPDLACPLLIMTSRADHVVPPVSSDVLAEAVSGPVERVWLERSFHMATLDADRDEVERRTVEFAGKVLG
jgi:carboxylesterase